MFKNLVADSLGLSDIGRIINQKDYDKADSDDYIFNEDGEVIYFLIKSKSDEYCFTNFALIHLDGTSAVSKKRLLKRYEYYKNPIKNVLLETAGTIDLDVEIKFSIGEEKFSIDVIKDSLVYLKLLYKALVKISAVQEENKFKLDLVEKSMLIAQNTLTGIRSNNSDVSKEFGEIYDFVYDNTVGARQELIKKDFSDIFQKYINNK